MPAPASGGGNLGGVGAGALQALGARMALHGGIQTLIGLGGRDYFDQNHEEGIQKQHRNQQFQLALERMAQERQEKDEARRLSWATTKEREGAAGHNLDERLDHSGANARAAREAAAGRQQAGIAARTQAQRDAQAARAEHDATHAAEVAGRGPTPAQTEAANYKKYSDLRAVLPVGLGKLTGQGLEPGELPTYGSTHAANEERHARVDADRATQRAAQSESRAKREADRQKAQAYKEGRDQSADARHAADRVARVDQQRKAELDNITTHVMTDPTMLGADPAKITARAHAIQESLHASDPSWSPAESTPAETSHVERIAKQAAESPRAVLPMGLGASAPRSPAQEPATPPPEAQPAPAIARLPAGLGIPSGPRSPAQEPVTPLPAPRSPAQEPATPLTAAEARVARVDAALKKMHADQVAAGAGASGATGAPTTQVAQLPAPLQAMMQPRDPIMEDPGQDQAPPQAHPLREPFPFTPPESIDANLTPKAPPPEEPLVFDANLHTWRPNPKYVPPSAPAGAPSAPPPSSPPAPPSPPSPSPSFGETVLHTPRALANAIGDALAPAQPPLRDYTTPTSPAPPPADWLKGTHVPAPGSSRPEDRPTGLFQPTDAEAVEPSHAGMDSDTYGRAKAIEDAQNKAQAQAVAESRARAAQAPITRVRQGDMEPPAPGGGGGAGGSGDPGDDRHEQLLGLIQSGHVSLEDALNDPRVPDDHKAYVQAALTVQQQPPRAVLPWESVPGGNDGGY